PDADLATERWRVSIATWRLIVTKHKTCSSPFNISVCHSAKSPIHLEPQQSHRRSSVVFTPRVPSVCCSTLRGSVVVGTTISVSHPPGLGHTNCCASRQSKWRIDESQQRRSTSSPSFLGQERTHPERQPTSRIDDAARSSCHETVNRTNADGRLALCLRSGVG